MAAITSIRLVKVNRERYLTHPINSVIIVGKIISDETQT